MIQSIAVTSALASTACAIIAVYGNSERRYDALRVDDLAIYGSDDLLRIHLGRDPLANCYGVNLYAQDDQRVAVFWYQGENSGLLLGSGGAFHDLAELEVASTSSASLSLLSESYEGLVAIGAKKPHLSIGVMSGSQIPHYAEGFVRVMDYAGNIKLKY